MTLALEFTAATVAEDLAWDEALLEAVAAGSLPPVLRFWERPDYAVVLGANGSVAIDVDADACRADGVPLARRSSGGGTVVLGPGCLLFSLALPFSLDPALRDVTRSYRLILGRIAAALATPADGTPGEQGTSDLTLGLWKVSGNAQQRKADAVLHHGTLLLDFDLSRVSRYLRPPERQPAYRADRPHGAFVRNLPLTAAEARRRLREAWAVTGEADIGGRDDLRGRVAELVAEKYGDGAWVGRR